MNHPDDGQSKNPQPVTLYDSNGNPVHVSPEYIQQASTQTNSETDLQNPNAKPSQDSQDVSPQSYSETARQEFGKEVQTTSHVTNAGDNYHQGYGFDPQVRSQYANEPKVVHTTRPIEPQQPELSDEVKQLHEKSVQSYPEVNLSVGEFVLHDVRRHPIGLLMPIGVSGGIILVIMAVLFSYPFVVSDMPEMPISFAAIAMVAIALIVLVAAFGYIAIWVYLKNRLLLTNESVIQEIQHSLFARHEQTVSLGSVEDASYHQRGLIQTMFNYGSIRLSTEGEETTYRFYYVENPKRQVAILTNAVEAFKNGRPVTGDLLK